MKILLGVTGGIAAYKACDIITGLKATGHEVRVVMSESAQQFITPLTLGTISENPVMTSMWYEGPKVDHIEAAKWCDVIVVAPATLNSISKFAYGLADNLLSTIFSAIPVEKPRLIFPAMNTAMLESPGMKRACEILGGDPGCFIYETVNKRLACGDVGKGALMRPRDIVDHINKICDTLKD